LIEPSQTIEGSRAAAGCGGREARLTVSTLLVRALVEAAERAGVSREALLHDTLEPSRLADIGARIEHADFETLLLRALDLTGNEAFPLQMAEWASEGAFDVVAHMISHAPTLRHAIDLGCRFGRLISDGTQLRLSERAGTATLAIEFVRSSPRMDRAHAEFVLMGLLRMLQVFGGPSTRVSGVVFEHARPAHHAHYTRAFSGAERFGQRCTAILFDAALLDRPHLHQHSQLYDVLLPLAEQQLSQVSNGVGLAQRVEEYLRARPAARIPDMRTAARDHGLSVRSLRRRLTEAGLSYRALVRSVLERRATELLRDQRRSLQETAVALGFADATAFHRAFKRWTGTTPHEFREAASAIEFGDKRAQR
jgi:AraC-like DNA-binding protein